MRRASVLSRLSAAAVWLAALSACNDSRHEPSPVAVEAAPSRRAALPAATAPGVVAAAAAAAPTASGAALGAAAPDLHVPRAKRRILPSSHFDVELWGPAVNTHTLLDEQGKGAVPVSEARFLFDDDRLYVAFYAGDLELTAHATKPDGPIWRDDSLTLSFFDRSGHARLIGVSVTGVLADGTCPADAATLEDARCDLKWRSGSVAAADYDGSLNEPGGHDEEWNIQLALPLSALGIKPGDSVRFWLRRCEVGQAGQGACGGWGSPTKPATLVLDAELPGLK